MRAVEHRAHECRLQGGAPADRAGQQLRAEGAQHGHRENRETDLSDEGSCGEQETGRVGAPPALDGERAEGDQQRPVEDDPLGPTAREQGHEHRHDDRGASDEDTWYGRFGAALRGEHREVESDHPDGRQQGEPPPLTPGEMAQRRRGALAEQGHQKQAGEGVPEELAARVRVVPEEAVGREGGAD